MSYPLGTKQCRPRPGRIVARDEGSAQGEGQVANTHIRGRRLPALAGPPEGTHARHARRPPSSDRWITNSLSGANQPIPPHLPIYSHIRS